MPPDTSPLFIGLAPKMARHVQRVAGEDARAERKPGVWSLFGTNHPVAVSRLLPSVAAHGGRHDDSDEEAGDCRERRREHDVLS